MNITLKIHSSPGVFFHSICAIYRWLSTRWQYLQCVSNGDTAVLLLAIDIFCTWCHCSFMILTIIPLFLHSLLYHCKKYFYYLSYVQIKKLWIRHFYMCLYDRKQFNFYITWIDRNICECSGLLWTPLSYQIGFSNWICISLIWWSAFCYEIHLLQEVLIVLVFYLFIYFFSDFCFVPRLWHLSPTLPNFWWYGTIFYSYIFSWLLIKHI